MSSFITDKTGFVIQIIIVCLALAIIYSGQLAGILLLIPALFVDCFIKGPKRDTVGTSVKLLLLFQGIMVWIVINTQLSSKDLFDNNSESLIARTRNVVHPNFDRVIEETVAFDKLIPDTKSDENKRNFGSNEVRHLAVPMQTATSFSSTESIKRLFDGIMLPPVEFADLKFRSRDEVRDKLHRVFTELPEFGFKAGYRNPCWNYNPKIYPYDKVTHTENVDGLQMGLACLPYAYILGQPKCGTSDLYERLKKHTDIR